MKIKTKIWFFIFSLLLFTTTCSVWIAEGSNNEDFLEQAFWPAIYNDAIVGGDTIWTTKKTVGNYVLKDGVEIDVDAFNIKAKAKQKELQEEKESLLIKIDAYVNRNQWQYTKNEEILEYVSGWAEFQSMVNQYNQLTLQEQTIEKNKKALWSVSVKKRPSLIISITKFLLRMTMVLSVTMVIFNGILYVIKSSKGENAKDVLQNLLYVGIWMLLALLSVVIIRLISSVGTSSLNTITYQVSSFFIS